MHVHSRGASLSANCVLLFVQATLFATVYFCVVKISRFGGWSRGTARDAYARTEDAEPGPGRVGAGPTRPRPLPQGGRAGATPFAPSHRPGQLLGGAPPAVADPAGSCVSACGELPCSAFCGSAVFPSVSRARPAAPSRARGRVFQRSAAPRACVDLGARLCRRRDGVRRRVGGCEVPFL